MRAGDGVTVEASWRYLVGFLALTILCGTSHEFAHHFTGAAVCGGFGDKTFNSFELVPGCSLGGQVIANLAGPTFTFALMWWGVTLLRRENDGDRRMGIALIFANFPINRLFFVLVYANDEDYSRSLVYPSSELAHWITVALVWLIALPPVVLAWRAIENRPRWAWRSAFLFLPFAFVVIFAGFFLEEYLLLEEGVLAGRIVGVPWLIILTEVICLGLYLAFGRSLREGSHEAASKAPRRDR